MNIRQLNYFVNVVDKGSITRAAEFLNMSQPALSRQIKAFEEDLGWKLFERTAKSLQLTYAGEVVSNEGKRILQSVENGYLNMQRAINGGVIRIGFAPSLGANILKRAISCFSQRHPKVSIQLFDSSSKEMRSKLLAGELELMLEVKSPEKEFEWKTLKSIENYLAIPEAHTLTKKIKNNSLEIKYLHDQPFLLLSRFDYPSYWEKVASYFSTHKVNVKVAGEFDGIESLAIALDAGLGVAFVSEHSKLPQGVKRVKLNPKPHPVEVAVGWNASRPLDPATTEFIEELVLASRY